MGEEEKSLNYCFACGKDNPYGLKLEFSYINDEAIAEFTARPEHQGYNGVMHGGLIATLLDEAMAKWLSFNGIRAVTAEMSIKFKKPVPIGVPLTVKGKMIYKKRKIYEMESYVIGPEEQVLAFAVAKFWQTEEGKNG